MIHYTTEQGLSSNRVYSIYRDSRGFLWLATDKGAVKYNGLEFEKFTTNDGLPYNDIFFFEEDHEGRLWISAYNGDLCYYKDGVFHTAANTPFLKLSFNHLFPEHIEVEQDSTVTIICHDQTKLINIKGERYVAFPLKKTVYYAFLDACVQKTAPNKFHLFAHHQSFIIDTAGNYTDTMAHRNDDEYRYFQSQGGKYLCSPKGIYSLNEDLLLKITNKAIANSTVYRVAKLGGNWYICTNDGLFINNDIQILKGVKVSGIVADIEGNLWVSSLDNGIYCLEKNYLNSSQYTDAYRDGIKYAHAGGRLFFTTNNNNFYRLDDSKAVLLFDYHKNFTAHYGGEKAWEANVLLNTFAKGIDNADNYYNIEPRFSFILDHISAKRQGVHIFKDAFKGVFPNTPYDGTIKELLMGKDSLFIKNSYYFAVVSKPEPGKNSTLKVVPVEDRVFERPVFGATLAPDNILWYADLAHVYKGMNGAVQPQFGNITFKEITIAGNYLVGISHKNQLVICTDFEAENIHIDTIKGANFIWDRLYKINDSLLLLSTDNLYYVLALHAKGKTRYELKTVENAFIPSGAEYICCNDSCCYFFKNGNITRVPVSDLNTRHTLPELFFRYIKTVNGNYPVQQVMNLGYEECRNISVTFLPFSFGSKYLVCEYSIGRDTTSNWRPVTNNEINLFEPGYGSYTVKVRARTLSGPFGAPSVFHFNIAKPFWATWWFIICVVVLFVILLLVVMRAVVAGNARKKEAAHNNEIKFLKSEYKALNALMNPHFIFNTLNNVQWLVNSDDKMTANHYLRVFSDLVRQNMANITKELIPLSSELELVGNYLKLEKLRFKDALNYEINIEGEVDTEDVLIPPLLIQPLVENAIKHGLLPGETKSNLLEVNIYKQAGELYIDIKDNGIGYNEAQKKVNLNKSTGIDNARKRIEQLNIMHGIHMWLDIKELHNEAGIPTGTLARVCIGLNDQ